MSSSIAVLWKTFDLSLLTTAEVIDDELIDDFFH